MKSTLSLILLILLATTCVPKRSDDSISNKIKPRSKTENFHAINAIYVHLIFSSNRMFWKYLF